VVAKRIALLGIFAALSCWAPAVQAVSIDVGSAAGVPGQQVTFNVTLNDMGERVAATKNFIGVDPDIPLISCERNSAINKPLTTRFEPTGCEDDDGVDCLTVQALVLALSNLNRIPNGSVLYSCVVQIRDDAEEGSHRLLCTRGESSDPDGNAFTTDCNNGSIEVSRTTPTPTATPDIPTPAVTSSRLAASIGVDDSVVPLIDASQFPDAGTVVIDGEIIGYRAKAENSLTGASRGQFGTPVTQHVQGAFVVFVMTKGGGGGGGGCSIDNRTMGAGPWISVLLAAAALLLRRRLARS
jgi:hypothetical protein